MNPALPAQLLVALEMRRRALLRKGQMLHIDDRQLAAFYFQANHQRLPGRIGVARDHGRHARASL